MPTLEEVRTKATARLSEAGIPSPEVDARYLLEAATGLTHAGLISARHSDIPLDQLALLGNFISRRLNREPVGRILGWREFWGLRFALSPATLEPRPDSETLIEAVLARRPDRTTPLRICDLGTGTGCLLAALLHEYPNATGTGTDLSAEALATARENLAALGLSSRAILHQGNWLESMNDIFDIIISNPPYIMETEDLEAEVRNHDPALALFAGQDGLEAYRALLPRLKHNLAPHGLAILEIGIGQSEALRQLATQNTLNMTEIRQDINEIPRAAIISGN